jgi:phospholipid/cholesterol/gamma-HCH transport system substrate-binding protein
VNRSLLLRVGALVAVLVASVWYIGFDVIGWRLGAQAYPVTVLLPQGGGIYTEADVTYRGVTVGRVVRLELTPTHVAVIADINPGVLIPADTAAHVRQMDAAGEQYLDLVPEAAGGPYLHAGSVIAASHTTIPVAISQVLADTSRLLDSINARQLDTVASALGTGFAGTDRQLRTIVVAGQSLFHALQSASGATIDLIVAGRTVLDAARNTDAAFGRFAAGLDALSAQLARSAPDFQALLHNSVAAEQQGSALLAQYSAQMRSLTDHLGAVSGVTLAEQPELKALLQVLPVFAGEIGAVVRGGSLHTVLDYNTNSPVCSYISGQETPLPTQKVSTPALNRTCKLSSPVRGGG